MVVIEYIQLYPNILLLAGMAMIGIAGIYVATLAVISEHKHNKRMREQLRK